MHPFAHVLCICTFSVVAPFLQFIPTVSFNSIPPLSTVVTTRARKGGPKEHSAKQKWPRETHSVTYVPGLSTLSDLSHIDAQPPPSFLCCPRPPSHHPSSLTSVYLVPDFRHQHPSGQTVLIFSSITHPLSIILIWIKHFPGKWRFRSLQSSLLAQFSTHKHRTTFILKRKQVRI